MENDEKGGQKRDNLLVGVDVKAAEEPKPYISQVGRKVDDRSRGRKKKEKAEERRHKVLHHMVLFIPPTKTRARHDMAKYRTNPRK